MTTWSILCHGGPRDGERVNFPRDDQTHQHPPTHYRTWVGDGSVYEYELVETRVEGADCDTIRWEYR